MRNDRAVVQMTGVSPIRGLTDWKLVSFGRALAESALDGVERDREECRALIINDAVLTR
jgi:hypothetical protein